MNFLYVLLEETEVKDCADDFGRDEKLDLDDKWIRVWCWWIWWGGVWREIIKTRGSWVGKSVGQITGVGNWGREKYRWVCRRDWRWSDLESEGDEVHAYQEVKFGEVVDV